MPPVQEGVPQPIPAQWYSTPRAPSQWRFWDGHQWMENVSPAPKVAHLPLRSNRQTNALNAVTVGGLIEVIEELARGLRLAVVVPTGVRVADHRGSGTTRPVVEYGSASSRPGWHTEVV